MEEKKKKKSGCEKRNDTSPVKPHQTILDTIMTMNSLRTRHFYKQLEFKF